MVTGSSYGPFLLLATTLHAFPVGWALLYEPHAHHPSVIPSQSFSVVFMETPAPLPEVSSVNRFSELPLKNKPSSKEIDNKTKSNFSRSDRESSPHLPSQTKVSEEKTTAPLVKKSNINPIKQINGQEETATIIPMAGNIPPSYPLEAIEKKIEGTVFLRLTIHASGKVHRIEAIPPFAPSILQEAALRAVKKWYFKITNGRIGTSFILEIPIDFKEEEEKGGKA